MTYNTGIPFVSLWKSTIWGAYCFDCVCKAVCFSLKLKRWSKYNFFASLLLRYTELWGSRRQTHLCIQGVCSRSRRHVTLWIWQLVLKRSLHYWFGLSGTLLGTTCGPVPLAFMLHHQMKLKGEKKKTPNVKRKIWLNLPLPESLTRLCRLQRHMTAALPNTFPMQIWRFTFLCHLFLFILLPVHKPAWWAGPFSLTFFTNMVSIGSIRPFW